jgi:hypothetical protein
MSLAIDPGTFENPGGVGAWSASGGVLTQSAAQAHSGTYSALLTVSGTPGQAYIRAYGASAVPIVPGTLYEITMWVRSPQALDVLPAADFYDGSSNYVGGEYPASVALVPNTWTLLSTTFLAPPGTALAVYGPTAVSPANGNTLYVDDVDIDYPVVAGVTVDAVEQDSWPPRVQISVTGLTDGDAVEVHRQVAGVLTPVRGGSVESTDDPAFVIVDAELPFGVPVSWVVFINGVGIAVDGDTYTLPGGKVAISDAITGRAAEVVIGAAGDKSYARKSARFNVAGRNMVVSGPMGEAEGTYELLVETTSSLENLKQVLRTATQGIVQIRQAGVSALTGDPYDGVDAYLAVDKAVERRYSQDGSDPRRLVVIDYAEVDGWAGDLTASGFTLQDIADYLDPGATLQDLAGLYPGGTLLQIALADWTP